MSNTLAFCQRLVDGVNDEYLFYSCRPDGEIDYVSPSVERVLGYTREELTAHFRDYLTDNEINTSALKRLESDLDSGHSLSYELEIICKSGHCCWLEARATPSIDQAGKLLSIDVIAHDITERKASDKAMTETLEALRASNKRLEEAQHLGKIGNWEYDLINDKLFWSRQIYEIFGIDPEKFEASYDAFLDAIYPDDREMVDEAYGYSVESGRPYDIVHRIIRKSDGAVRYVHELSKEIRDKAGETIRSMGTVQDITERVQMERDGAGGNP
ncbi:MAG: PAS domain-containing protein [Candidatus Sedimenticola sp. 6PFRAG7]